MILRKRKKVVFGSHYPSLYRGYENKIFFFFTYKYLRWVLVGAYAPQGAFASVGAIAL